MDLAIASAQRPLQTAIDAKARRIFRREVLPVTNARWRNGVLRDIAAFRKLPGLMENHGFYRYPANGGKHCGRSVR